MAGTLEGGQAKRGPGVQGGPGRGVCGGLGGQGSWNGNALTDSFPRTAPPHTTPPPLTHPTSHHPSTPSPPYTSPYHTSRPPTHTHTHTRTHTHSHTHTHVHTHMRAHAHTHIHTLIHLHMHTHTHARSLTHGHTHTLARACTLTLTLAHSHAHTLCYCHTPLTTCPAVTWRSALSWQRVRAALLMAATGKEWVQVFSTANSGTYNNQYMVVDLKQFTPQQVTHCPPRPSNTHTRHARLCAHIHTYTCMDLEVCMDACGSQGLPIANEMSPSLISHQLLTRVNIYHMGT